jgi:hypothetical protein
LLEGTARGAGAPLPDPPPQTAWGEGDERQPAVTRTVLPLSTRNEGGGGRGVGAPADAARSPSPILDTFGYPPVAARRGPSPPPAFLLVPRNGRRPLPQLRGRGCCCSRVRCKGQGPLADAARSPSPIPILSATPTSPRVFWGRCEPKRAVGALAATARCPSLAPISIPDLPPRSPIPIPSPSAASPPPIGRGRDAYETAGAYRPHPTDRIHRNAVHPPRPCPSQP